MIHTVYRFVRALVIRAAEALTSPSTPLAVVLEDDESVPVVAGACPSCHDDCIADERCYDPRCPMAQRTGLM